MFKGISWATAPILIRASLAGLLGSPLVMQGAEEALGVPSLSIGSEDIMRLATAGDGLEV
jgi:hypothetical protein